MQKIRKKNLYCELKKTNHLKKLQNILCKKKYNFNINIHLLITNVYKLLYLQLN